MKDCEECEDVVNQVYKSSVKKFLREKHGSDKIEIRNVDDDVLAMAFVWKYNDWNLPYLVKVDVEDSKLKICKLADDYSVEGCIVLDEEDK